MERSVSFKDAFRTTLTRTRSSGTSIFRRLTGKKGASEQEENKSQDAADLAATEALLQQPMRLLKHDKSFLDVTLQVETSEEQTYLVMNCNDQELERLLLEVTSVVMETVLGENAFEVITVNKVLHLSPYSGDVTLAWIAHLRAFIAQCEPYPDDGLYKEALIRQPGESYDVKLTKKQPLGVTFERSVEWLHVKIGNNTQLSDFRIVAGSALYKINDSSVALWSYKDVLDTLSVWKPPMKLTFRRGPTKKGFLNRCLNGSNKWRRRYFELSEGILRYFDNDSRKKRGFGKARTFGMSVRLADPAVVGRENCFVILYGFDELVMQADSREEMFDWACALYYGIAISNGGGYVLALEALCVKENKSKQEVVAEAIARMAKKELLRNSFISPEDLNRAEQEVMEGVMDDLARKELEELTLVIEDEPLEAVDSGGASEDPVCAESEADLPIEFQDSIDDSYGLGEDEDDEIEALPDVEMEPEMASAADVPLEAADEYLAPDVTIEDVKRVFHIYAKPGKTGAYINVMQFSTIWRLARKAKRNLFEEMKVFNSMFDLEGKGYAVEADFIRGWKTVSKRGGFGEEILFNLAKIENGVK